MSLPLFFGCLPLLFSIQVLTPTSDCLPMQTFGSSLSVTGVASAFNFSLLSRRLDQYLSSPCLPLFSYFHFPQPPFKPLFRRLLILRVVCHSKMLFHGGLMAFRAFFQSNIGITLLWASVFCVSCGGHHGCMTRMFFDVSAFSISS